MVASTATSILDYIRVLVWPIVIVTLVGYFLYRYRISSAISCIGTGSRRLFPVSVQDQRREPGWPDKRTAWARRNRSHSWSVCTDW